ncbi:porin family protein [Pseudopedobacter sp.]|uniref:porin family protein n=1 Tax=Pseudopedobacter sp. TaxID=1936787 RepID=UPI00334256BC
MKNLKKCILLMFVAMGLSHSAAYAQFNVGIKGGLNYSTIKAKNQEIDKSGILGYNLGVWARVGNAFYLQPELYLGSKGAELKFEENGSSVEQTGKVKFTTLDLPVLLGTKFGLTNFNLRLMAGPSFQFNLDTDESAFSQATDIDFYRYRDFVTNLQAGAGVDIGNISVDLRYETGLQDINKNDGQKQNLVHLSLGWKIL